MVEDKYIGLALAVSSSVAIGTSFIITKKVQSFGKKPPPSPLPHLHQGLNDAAERSSAYANASDDYSYLKNPIWWAGIITSEWSSYLVPLNRLTDSCMQWLLVKVGHPKRNASRTLTVVQVANFAAYTFAPPILVTPLGALSVLIGYDGLKTSHRDAHPPYYQLVLSWRRSY